jgi:hypothetical protein
MPKILKAFDDGKCLPFGEIIFHLIIFKGSRVESY